MTSDIKCPLCKNPHTAFISEYYFNVEFDKKYIGKPNIYNCHKCNYSFVHPSPDKKKLEDYYTNIYRSKGRPHYFPQNINHEPDGMHYACLISLMPLLLDSDIVGNKKINILEIGPGWGEMGKLLKKVSSDLFSIVAIEPCIETAGHLKEAGYQIIDSSDKIADNSIDVVISMHVIEHFDDPNTFIDLYRTKLKKGGLVYLEMPNCRFNDGFEKRPYDSPHLSFWNSDSCKELAKLNNYKILSIYTSGSDIKKIFSDSIGWQKQFRNWKPNKSNFNIFNIFKKTKIKIKGFINNFLKKFGLKIITINQQNVFIKEIMAFPSNEPSKWLIRVIYKT